MYFYLTHLNPTLTTQLKSNEQNNVLFFVGIGRYIILTDGNRHISIIISLAGFDRYWTYIYKCVDFIFISYSIYESEKR